MSEKFIKIQLFGDAPADPQQPTGGQSPENPPQPAPENAPNDAEILYQFQKDYVPRSEMEKEKKRADSYLAAIYKNRESDLPEVKAKDELATKDIDKLVKDTFLHSDNMTDLQYVSNVLKIREARMAKGEPDPFAPANLTTENPFGKPNPSDEDLEISQKVADGLQWCVDEANGDNAAFLLAVQKILKDTPRVANYMRRR